MKLPDEVLEAIQAEAIADYPNEAVWLVTEAEGCYKVDNIHNDPENFFAVSSTDSFFAVKAGLLAVIHSHCDSPQVPSAEDMRLHIKLEVPCGILSTDGESATDIHWQTSEIQPLEGRPFAHATSDCFSIVKDYFKLKGITLEDVPRDWLWWESGDDILEELFGSRGFYEVPVTSAREGDVWIAQIRGPVAHHCGVLLADGLILHHPGSGDPIDHRKLSIKEPIYRYMPYIRRFLRHKECK